MSVIVAIDIGGTQLRAAVFSQNSTEPQNIQRTATQGREKGVFDRLTGLIDSVWPEEQVAAVCVASPGPLNPHEGLIYSTPNIPDWVDFPLAQKLQDRYHVPTFLDNDANLAALGEWRFGAGRGHKDVLYLTISTGIGGGVISDGRLLSGARGMATELGHVTVVPNGPPCSCGRPGHLEAVASGPGIVRYVREQIRTKSTTSLSDDAGLTARTVAQAAHAGDALAQEAYAQAGTILGRALADFLHVFNPSIVIFGGGVSQAGALLFDPMKASLEKSVMDPFYMEDLIITTAELGDSVGLLGALALAHIKLQPSGQ
jgi:glucokinase